MSGKPGVSRRKNCLIQAIVWIGLLFIPVSSALSAGYSCPSYIKYTSCSSGYYMTYGGAYNGAPTAGNACTACPPGYDCAGGTANAVLATCAPGTWMSNGSCVACGPNAYCNNNTQYSCPPNNQNLAALSGGTVLSQVQTWTSGSTDISQCMGDSGIRVVGGEYLAECSWNGSNYYDNCNGNYLWYLAHAGYYLSGYRATTYLVWYSGVTACTNKPANSHYTGAGSPDTNNCAWACDNGYRNENGTCVRAVRDCAVGGIANGYQDWNGSDWGACRPISATVGCHWGYYNNNGVSCELCPPGEWCYNSRNTCPAGYFCPGGLYDPRYEGYGNTYKCPSFPGNYYLGTPNVATTDAGADSVNDCYVRAAYRWENHGFWGHIDGWSSPSPCYWDGSDYKTCTKMFFECEQGYSLSSIKAPGFENSCQPCAAGSYAIATIPSGQPLYGGGQTPPYSGAQSCTLCPSGTYGLDTAQTSEASCISCPALPGNAVADYGTVGSDGNRDAITSCYANGLHLWDGAGTRKPTSNLWDGACKNYADATGNYDNNPVWTYCDCAAGYVMDNTNANNQCTLCPAGAACPGSRAITLRNGATVYERGTAITTSDMCQNGQYQDQIGQTICKDCAAGQTGNTWNGATACVAYMTLRTDTGANAMVRATTEKPTSPALSVQQGGTTYYGALSTSGTGVKLTINGTTYTLTN